MDGVRRLVLTASGGPFREWDPDRLRTIGVADALRHPTWQMGPKITIDSATLMNKGLEAIEAHWLFGVPFDRIDIVVHPTSIVHSVVEFVDGSLKAQLGWPDMRLPIQLALTAGERLVRKRSEVDPASRPFSLAELGSLPFEAPSYERFPCLGLALEAGRTGGTAPAILSAADEVAVDSFLNRGMRFGAIAEVISETLESIASTPVTSSTRSWRSTRMHAKLPPVSCKGLGDARPRRRGSQCARSNHTWWRGFGTDPELLFRIGVTENRSAGVYRMNGSFHE